jgi:hypothetical protein
MNLRKIRVPPNRPTSKGFAVADLIVWGVLMLWTGSGLVRAMVFGDMPGYWFLIQSVTFALHFGMFKRALDGWHWYLDNR